MRDFSEFCSEEFKDYFFNCMQGKERRTIDEYISYVSMICNKYLKDFLDLTQDDVESYFYYLNSKLADGKITRKTIGTRLSCYRTLAQFISEKDETYHSPFTRIIRPQTKADFDPNKIPTMRELDLIMSEAKSDPQLFLILSLATRVGLSSSSILSLRYNSVMRERGHVYLFFAAKSDFKQDSFIQMPEDVAELIVNYCGDNLGASDSVIFRNKYKNPLSLVNLDRAVAKVIKKCGLDGYTLKDFRNRAILEMAQAGASPESLSGYTGLSPTRLESFITNKDLVSGTCPADLVNYRLIV